MKIGIFSIADVTGIAKMILDSSEHSVSAWWKFPAISLKKWKGVDKNGLESLYPDRYKAEPNLPFNDWLSKVDFVFVDYNAVPEAHANKIYASGKPFVMSSAYGTALEHNRELAKDIVTSTGLMRIPPPAGTVSSTAELLDLLDKYKKPVVLKGLDDTVVTNSIEEAKIIAAADTYKFFNRNNKVFVEERISGVEIAFGRYLQANGEWAEGWVLTQEYKGACNDNRGNTLTAETGTVVKVMPSKEIPEKVKSLFEHLRKLLFTTRYVGFFDVNTIYCNNDFYFLEFTTRPGYPTELEVGGGMGVKGYSYADFLIKMADPNGPTLDLVKMLPKFGAAVAVYTQGLGYAKKFPKMNSPVVSNIKRKSTVLAPFDSYYNDKGQLFSWNEDRAVYVTSYASTLSTAIKNLYEDLKRVHCYGHTWRDDIGSNWRKKLDSLAVLGNIFLTPTVSRKAIVYHYSRKDSTLSQRKDLADRMLHSSVSYEAGISKITKEPSKHITSLNQNFMMRMLLKHDITYTAEGRLIIGYDIW